MPGDIDDGVVVEASRGRRTGRKTKKRCLMKNDPPVSRPAERWACFRFSVIGPLLAAPPPRGELQNQLRELAARSWGHPMTGQPVQFGLSTLERWYHAARREKSDPVKVLRRKIRSDQGTHPALSPALRAALAAQHRQHPNWSYQLHADNLAALIGQHPELGSRPGYASVRRYMKASGLVKRRRLGPAHRPGARAAERRLESREVRGYESEYVNALWHLDFHHGSLRVLLENGQWAWPLLLGVLDDHSRLCCHLQWYLAEGAEELCHGLGQDLQKRALPRALLSDNGPAMLAAETTQGLARLGILHETTLPYSPYQNGKQEVFWGQIEGRLLPMLEGVADLTLRQLNEASLAWVEMEYNRKVHAETGQTPLRRYLDDKDAGRPSPSTEALQLAFTREVRRAQRRSDGTLTLEGIRFEVPSRYGHLASLTLRAAAWDLGRVHLSDPATGAVLCRLYPQDKTKNVQGRRAARVPIPGAAAGAAPAPGALAPLLQKLIKEYAATGLPPAYLPKDELSTRTPSA
jgi:putative transposase